MSKKNKPEAKVQRRLEREEHKSRVTVPTKRQMWVKTKDRYGRTVLKPVMMPVLKGRS